MTDPKPAPKPRTRTRTRKLPSTPAVESAPKPRTRTRPGKPASTPAATPAPAGETGPATEPPPEAVSNPTPELPGPEPAPARRRIVVTGGAGFVGSAVCRVLHERGDQVVALVRDPGRAGRLHEMAAEGLELVEDDLSDVTRLTEQLRDADAVIHAAGSYRVGIQKSERGTMWDANVGTTTRVLDAAEAAGTPRIVYLSTVGIHGNTHGAVVDETHRRDLRAGFTSWYDETKYGAHEVVEQRIAGGAPIVIALPSQVYGDGDHSEVGEQLRRASKGQLRYSVLDEVGVGFVHVADLAAGIVAALDRGRPGESYVLSGPTAHLADAIAIAASVNGHRAPRLRIPTGLLRALAPIGPLFGRPNVRELISAGARVTHWASAAKAEAELGWHARDLETGFRNVFGRP